MSFLLINRSFMVLEGELVSTVEHCADLFHAFASGALGSGLCVDLETCLRKICDRRKQESIVPDTCRRRCVKFGHKGPSTKYATLFWNNFDPPFACHTLSHISRPPKVA